MKTPDIGSLATQASFHPCAIDLWRSQWTLRVLEASSGLFATKQGFIGSNQYKVSSKQVFKLTEEGMPRIIDDLARVRFIEIVNDEGAYIPA
ncbi:hypothetical protein I5535_19930 [Rhodobacteraceae bacterium F11138]|nr:hypothetical protein [Rhodobacteraceae bacterium F11138]